MDEIVTVKSTTMQCPHEFTFGGLCAACGKDVSHLSKESVKLASIDRNIHGKTKLRRTISLDI